jgi:hypothetical protein
VFYEILGRFPEFVVLAAEGNDADLPFFTGTGSHAIAVEAGTSDDLMSPEFTRRGQDHPGAAIPHIRVTRGARAKSSPGIGKLADHRRADGRIVDNAFLGHPYGGKAGRVRLYFPECVRGQPFEPAKAVCRARSSSDLRRTTSSGVVATTSFPQI